MFMWYFSTRGGGSDLSSRGWSFENILHSNRRWRAVCIAFSGHMQFGEGVLFILWRYERTLPWFVRYRVRRQLGQRGKENFWKVVGMNSFVWWAFAKDMYIAFQIYNLWPIWTLSHYYSSDSGQWVSAKVAALPRISMGLPIVILVHGSASQQWMAVRGALVLWISNLFGVERCVS
jgi:hypothetical protein